MKAAIYHFTDESKKRPKIYMKQLNILKEFAFSKGFTDTEIFCDMSLLQREHPEFDRFLSCSNQFKALITKDFYHISKNTLKCMKTMTNLKQMGIKVYTLENGSFYWDEAPYEKQKKIATYCCHFGPQNEMKEIVPVQNDILTLFTNKKTNWTVIDQYFDESIHQNDNEQKQLMKLLENKSQYDLLMVHNLNDIHWRTSNFCRIREKLQLDIYSLQEGFLKYEKEMRI